MLVVVKKPVISESALKQLVQLYGKPQNAALQPIGTKEGAAQGVDFKNLPDDELPSTKPMTKEQSDRITDLLDMDLN
jgi:hypothetical protein